MSEMRKTVYSFWSRSMHVMHCFSKGERVTIEFGAPFEGVSRYITTTPEVAQAIRNSYEFKIGNIVEDTAEGENKEETDDGSKTPTKPRMVTMAVPESSWLDMNMGSAPEIKRREDPMNAILNNGMEGSESKKDVQRALGERARQSEQMELFPDVLDTYEHEDAAGGEGKESKEGAGENSVMKIEDVQSYMEAKEYLKTVVKVSPDKIRTKADTIRYCQQMGIEFPNYKL